MKSIHDIINKVSNENITELARFFHLKKQTGKSIITAFNSFTNLYKLFQTLNQEELAILKIVYSGNDGITFGEIEKQTRISLNTIDITAQQLSQKLLIHVIKNRQLLHKKLDKIYAISELSLLLHISDDKQIAEQLENLSKTISDEIQICSPKKISKPEIYKFLEFLFKSSCIMSLNDLKQKFQTSFITDNLQKLYNDKIIQIFFNAGNNFDVFILAHPSTVSGLLKQIFYSKKHQVNCSNGFMGLNNLLYSFDTISTFGLFLTKQNEFRKIDKRRIKENIIPLTGLNGELHSLTTTAGLALYCLSNLNCIHFEKDVAHITLRPVNKDLNDPLNLLKKIIKNFSKVKHDNSFESPFVIPDSSTLHNIIKLVRDLQKIPYDFIKYLIFMMLIINSSKQTLQGKLNNRKIQLSNIESIINLLLALGIMNIENGFIKLSSIGYQLINNLIEEPEPAALHENNYKNIYINPDYTVMVSREEQPFDIIYNILAYTDIIKNDVILHLSINRGAIVKSQKRGMPVQKLIDILKTTAKNKMPQNLEFQLYEWSKQTIKINISEVIMLKTNHPSFIDELMHGKDKDLIIERISANHIIIAKDNIENIIKLGRKKEAVISLFND